MAAGLGFKTFTTGEVLTAADVNGYLMQGVLVFANAAARTSAITSPQEGQYSFLKDTNALEYYDGASWVGAPVGDITAVNAGTGISGGGSSGSVTITNDMATTITASGDIVVGTGNGTYDNLPIGSTGQVLTADTTVSPYKVKWAAAAGGGKVLQVVQGTLLTAVDTSGATYVDTGLSVSITPSAASSKVLILATSAVGKSSGSSNNGVYTNIMRGATQIAELELVSYTGTALELAVPWAMNYLDSPNTTSATTYKIQFKNQLADAQVYFNWQSATSTIIAMEIGA
jgi:hypothetical protein